MSECKLIITIPAFQIEENPVCDTSRFKFQLINLGSTLITASLALKVEDVSLLYIAHSGDISVVSGLYYYSLSAMTKNLDMQRCTMQREIACVANYHSFATV